MPLVSSRIATGAMMASLLAGFPLVSANDAPVITIGPAKRSLQASETTDRIIVRMREREQPLSATTADAVAEPMSVGRSRALSMTAGTVLTPVRRTGGGAHVLSLAQDMPLAHVESIVAKLRADPEIEHAEPDRRKVPLLVPNDQFYRQSTGAPGQWNLRDTAGGINAERAWDLTTGSANTVIALLDTGLLTNIDLTGRVLPGYDFISQDSVGVYATANDGDGRDSNATDPGNWLTQQEVGRAPFTECTTPQNSDWHGTHTAGIIAANANNSTVVSGVDQVYGIAGIDWNASILPVRVLGKCGGYTSDIIDGVRWAAGLPVPGVANNPRPANIINMSLGGIGACSTEEQNAINQALAQSSVKAIVTAAGNDGGSALNTSPANCTGVIAVTAVDINGRRAPYANGANNVTIAGPGGYFSCPGTGACAIPAEEGILSLFNTGTTSPATNSFAYVMGTSEAAAHLSGVVGLMLARNPGLKPNQIWSIFRTSSRPFPDTTCTTATCGSGLLDAYLAVQAAVAPPADTGSISFGGPGQVPVPSRTPTAGSDTPSPTSNASTGSGGGSGGGGCTTGSGGPPEWLLVALLLIATTRTGARALLSRRSARRTARDR